MKTGTVRAASLLMLVAAWVLDLFSPQLFVVAILLTAPIALSGVARDRRFTEMLVALALLADCSAGWFNAYQEQYRWQPVALGDRLLAAFAILLVGLLTVRTQQAGVRASQLAEKNSRSEAIKDVIYALSHDLRTPIVAARMTMQQALAGAYGPLPPAYREILSRSVNSNEELHRLAETLLLVARYESGEQSSTREAVDLSALVENATAELQGLFDGRDVHVRAEVGKKPLYVSGDSGELKRAVTNLLANAATWTPSHGHVFARVSSAEDSASISVQDDGYGVPEATRPRLFERFPGSALHSGSGLGLYIVRRIAEAHGGSVRYEPITPRGSLFTITLPAYNRGREI